MTILILLLIIIGVGVAVWMLARRSPKSKEAMPPMAAPSLFPMRMEKPEPKPLPLYSPAPPAPMVRPEENSPPKPASNEGGPPFTTPL